MKQLVIIVLVIIALLVAGCSGGTRQNSITQPFIGGNVALDVGLMEGMPPAAVYDNAKMPFAVGVGLHNVGEADIGPTTNNPFVRVSLTGIRPGAFGLTPAQMSQDLSEPLLGSHKNFDGTILAGQTRAVVFNLNYQEKLEGNLIQPIVANVCYDYETFATVPICFKNDIIENVQDAQICTLTGEKMPQNSGAPIQVTSLVENPLGPYRVMVNFNVEHVGTGDFYGRSNDETCVPIVTNMNKNRVHVTVTSQDNTMTIRCSQLNNGNTGTITLFSGAPMTVTCTLESSPGSNTRIFTEPLSINLRYRYGTSVLQQVVVQAVGNR